MKKKNTISVKINVRYVAVAVKKPERRSETTCKKKTKQDDHVKLAFLNAS